MRVAAIPVARCTRCRKDFCGMHAGLCIGCVGALERNFIAAQERRAEYWLEYNAKRSEAKPDGR